MASEDSGKERESRVRFRPLPSMAGREARMAPRGRGGAPQCPPAAPLGNGSRGPRTNEWRREPSSRRSAAARGFQEAIIPRTNPELGMNAGFKWWFGPELTVISRTPRRHFRKTSRLPRHLFRNCASSDRVRFLWASARCGGCAVLGGLRTNPFCGRSPDFNQRGLHCG
jgi:hypothetical protein